MSSRLARIVSSSAPLVGNLLNLALPGSGMVISSLAALFGAKSSDTEDIASKISVDPEAYLKLSQFEAENALEIEKLIANDRISARAMNTANVAATGKRDWVMDVIALLMVCGFFIMCFIVTFVPMHKENTDLMYMVIGQFSTGFITVLAFFFGASRIQASPHSFKRGEIDIPPPAQTR